MVATLSVSSHDFTPTCAEVTSLMKTLGINGDVTANTTVLDGLVEVGCRVRIASSSPKRDAATLWQRMRDRHALTCAHLSVGGDIQSGCVLDVLRPSLCPGSAP